MDIKPGFIYANGRGVRIRINKIEGNKIFFQRVDSAFGEIVWGFEDCVSMEIMNEILEGSVIVTEELLIRKNHYLTVIAEEARAEFQALLNNKDM